MRQLVHSTFGDNILAPFQLVTLHTKGKISHNINNDNKNNSNNNIITVIILK